MAPFFQLMSKITECSKSLNGQRAKAYPAHSHIQPARVNCREDVKRVLLGDENRVLHSLWS
jgi:phosphoenolpyruvate synthase/pyruvate phosphate dikinase